MIGPYHAGVTVAPALLAPCADPTFTGTVAVPAGTATAPGVAVSGDSDTGLFSPGADRLAVVTGGSERVRIDNTGGVQVGDTTGFALGERLSVAGFVALGDANHTAIFGPTGVGTVVLGSITASPLEMRTSNIQRLRIEADGAVCHGDAAPVMIVDNASFLRLRGYTVNTLPSAATAGRMIYVSDGSANRRLAVSDGSAWRFPDGSPVVAA
ncbi:hypothetical protein FBY14_12017 [Azospirillum brasilense]|nr:hypothetical protein FBY14_12017 [Azospirillum brasilense]